MINKYQLIIKHIYFGLTAIPQISQPLNISEKTFINKLIYLPWHKCPVQSKLNIYLGSSACSVTKGIFMFERCTKSISSSDSQDAISKIINPYKKDFGYCQITNYTDTAFVHVSMRYSLLFSFFRTLMLFKNKFNYPLVIYTAFISSIQNSFQI